MCSLCRLPVANYHNFGHFLTFGTPAPTPFTDKGQIRCVRAEQVLYLHAKFQLNVFIVSASGGQKPQCSILTLGPRGRLLFIDEGQIWCAIADPRYTLTCQISSRLVYSVAALCWRKTPIFAVFWTLAFSGVTNWQQSEKAGQGCTTTNLPLSNGIKIFSVLQRLHGEIGGTISDVQITTRMRANAQRAGRPAEYRWRLLFNAAKFG